MNALFAKAAPLQGTKKINDPVMHRRASFIKVGRNQIELLMNESERLDFKNGLKGGNWFVVLKNGTVDVRVKNQSKLMPGYEGNFSSEAEVIELFENIIKQAESGELDDVLEATKRSDL